MKILFCLFIRLILITNIILSQHQEIDSLKKELQKQIPDTTRVKIFAQLANNYSNYDSALFYAKLGLDLSKKNNYLKVSKP